MKKLKTTSVILPFANGLFLGVSRKYDHNDFGFAGGKCEEGESSIQCAVRETKEETGIEITSMNLIDIREYVNKTVEPHTLDTVYCYVVNECRVFNMMTPEELIEKGEGVTKGVTREELIAGSFGDYNEQILEVYDKWKGNNQQQAQRPTVRSGWEREISGGVI